jgi:cell division septation protein DedD
MTGGAMPELPLQICTMSQVLGPLEAPVAAAPDRSGQAGTAAGQLAVARTADEPAPTPSAQAAPASGNGAIQLGAFDTEADANAAWKALSGRFAYLAPLNHGVMTAEVGGRTFYRLRASGRDRAYA